MRAGFKGHVGDCVCRAICIAAELDYRDMYERINRLGARERRTKHRKRGPSSASDGVYKSTTKKLIASLGNWIWTPTMGIGTGCRVHLRDGELPQGRLIVSVSRHWVAVIDGVIYDKFDCSRGGTRCVYGYFWREE